MTPLASISLDCVTWERQACNAVRVTSCVVQILEGDAKGLLGIQSALGRYELDAEKADRQIVWFESIRIAPADKGPEALKQWLAVFKGENPNMVRSLNRHLPAITQRKKMEHATGWYHNHLVDVNIQSWDKAETCGLSLSHPHGKVLPHKTHWGH